MSGIGTAGSAYLHCLSETSVLSLGAELIESHLYTRG
jgi:hypothetical protein